jgi:uncharacterized protein YecT (DUF1311 family)
MKILTLALLLLGLVALASAAQTQKRDPCEGETTPEMRNCAGKKYKQADDELNKAYRNLMSKLDDEGHKSSLKTAQQAWLKYRDSHCDFVSYLNRGGTIYPVIFTDCMTSLTTARTKELKQQIEDLERL